VARRDGRRIREGSIVTARTRSIGVEVAGIPLATPVLIASGCAGTGSELHGLVDLRRVGGVVSRTVTVEPRDGSAPPRIVESPAGVVWDTGLQNPGIDAFVQSELPALAASSSAVFASIAGTTLEEYVRITGVLQGRAGLAAIEVHLSGPDREMERPVLGAHADRVTEVVGAVARISLVPVFAKLPGGVDVVPLAVAAARAGASGLTLCASPPALAIDRMATRPALGGATGWLSGPALKPMTLRAVAEIHRALPRMPLVASGGIRTADDAVEAMLAGASAVQVGTATLVDPSAPVDIAKGIVTELQRRAVASPADLLGTVAIGGGTPAVAEGQRA
jgi:dihydroorotate dehydrogenase (NAD+) catalytic subunit